MILYHVELKISYFNIAALKELLIHIEVKEAVWGKD